MVEIIGGSYLLWLRFHFCCKSILDLREKLMTTIDCGFAPSLIIDSTLHNIVVDLPAPALATILSAMFLDTLVATARC
jgi:hypothetical protein